MIKNLELSDKTAKLILNTKHYNTKHKTLDTNTLDSQNESRDIKSPLAPSGLAPPSLSTSGEAICFGVGNSLLVNSQFEYIAVSLKTQTKEELLVLLVTKVRNELFCYFLYKVYLL